MKLSDMQKKDIVEINSGIKVGKIIDAEIEINSGKIINFVIEKKGIKTIFSQERDVSIIFDQIKKIGEDVILINKHYE